MKKTFTLFALLVTLFTKAQWTSLAPMPQALAQLGAVWHPNGKIYVMNGHTSSSEVNTLYIYDIALNTWTTGANCPVTTRGISYCLGTDNKIYTIGGYPNNTNLLRYDVATNTWSTMASYSSVNWEGSMVSYNNKLYYSGGENVGSSFGIYDIAANTWSTGLNIPIPILQHKSVVTNNGMIYLLGGRSGTAVGTPMTTVQRYNIATGTWSSVTTMPSAKNGYGACVGPNNLIYAVCGKDNYGNGGGPFFNTVNIYNPCTNTWTTTTNHPFAHGELAVASNSAGIFAFGGSNGTNLNYNYFLPFPNISLSVVNLTLTPTSSVVCSGQSVTINATGAQTYTWNTGSTSSSITPTPSTSTNYSVNGLTSAGCVATGTISINVNLSPNITISGPNQLCIGNSVNLFAGGATTYTWNTGATSISITSSPTVNTTYTASGTSSNSCVGNSTFAVNVNNNPTITISGQSQVCLGSNVNLTANGASTYSWNTGATTVSISATPTANTTYTAIGTSTAGCSGSASQSVTVNALPTVSASVASNSVCVSGSTIALSGSPSGGVFTGTNVASNVFTPSSNAGTFTQNYVFTNTVTGCSNTATTTITVLNCTGLNNLASLQGLSVSPNPSNGNFTIELLNGLSKNIVVSDLTGRVVLESTSIENTINVNISNLASGIYYVKVICNNATEVVKMVKH